MGRLIDADELLTKIRLNYNNHQNVSASAIKDIIDTQPTAFDLDKVVEQLEERYADMEKAFDDEENELLLEARFCGILHGYGKAIEIVKDGGLE